MVSEPPGPECMGNTSGTGVSKLPNLITPTDQRVHSRGKWTKNMNKVAYECYIKSKPDARGYRKRMISIWDDMGMHSISEQRLADQVNQIKKKKWLEDLEMEEIKRRVEGENEPSEDIVPSSDTQECGEVGEGSEEDRFFIDPASEAEWNELSASPSESGVLGQREVRRERCRLEGRGDITMNPAPQGPIEEAEPRQDLREEPPDLDIEEGAILNRLKEIMISQDRHKLTSLKACDKVKVRAEARKVNAVIGNITVNNITQCNDLLYAAAYVVTEKLGKNKNSNPRKNKEEPAWKRRIQGNINQWRADISRIEQIQGGKMKASGKEFERMNTKYKILEKGTVGVSQMLKMKVKAGATKIHRFEERNMQYHQNNTFRNDMKRFFKEINGQLEENSESPDPTEATQFWSDIWSKPCSHNKEAEWLENIKDKVKNIQPMQDRQITIQDVKGGIRKMSNWKSAGPDLVQGFWFKQMTNIHQEIALHLQECVNQGNVPSWMVKGRTVLIQKDKAKGRVASNYRPIACLPLMWKLLTGIFAEGLYQHLENTHSLPDEQKGCRKESRGTKDQLLIDKAVLKNCRRRAKNLAVAWIDYRKAYDLVPHSWILECLSMFNVAPSMHTLIANSMGSWRTELTSGGEILGSVDIKRGIFQGDSLSPLLFVLIMIPLTMLLREAKSKYKLEKDGPHINHLLFMDDLKLYASKRDQLDSLVATVHLFSNDIGMQFGIDKCAVLEMHRGTMAQSEGITLPGGEVMQVLEEEGYKYLGVLQLDKPLYEEMKDKIKTEYIRRVKRLCSSKLNSGNLVTGINAWAIGVIRYSAGIIKWTKEELANLDRKTRKIMTMNRNLHPRSSVARLYLKRKDGGRGLISVEECVETESKGLHDYLGGSEEELLRFAKTEGVLKEDETKEAYKSRVKGKKESEWKEKALHGQYVRDIEGKTDGDTWRWLRNGFLKPETEGMILAAQEQSLRTRAIQSAIDGRDVSPLCRMCATAPETAMHIVSACPKIAQTWMKERHDRVAAHVHWELCRKYGIECSEKWYEHTPTDVENEVVEITWDQTVQTDRYIRHNRPDIIVKLKEESKWILIDIAVPADYNIEVTEGKKIEKYRDDLGFEIQRIYRVAETPIVPVVIGALGAMPKQLRQSLETLGIPDIAASIQMTAILATAGIIRRVLNRK